MVPPPFPSPSEGGKAPPWAGPGEWERVNAELARTCGRRHQGSEKARRLAAALGNLFPLLDDLCARTCPSCEDVCCRAARVWFDLPDLILLHLLDKPLPPGQTRTSLSQPCRYLAPAGCTQPRWGRPWRCTWFLCSDQVELISAWPPREQRRLAGIFQEVLESRAAMAEAFTEPPGSDW